VDGGQEGSPSVRERYDRWHAERDVSDDDHHHAPWHELAREHLGDVAGLKVIEIGCGRGGFARYLQQQGAHLIAADFSHQAVDIARRRLTGLPFCEVVVADIQAMPYDAETFDVAISLETLEHVPEPDRGLRELVRVTKLGGRIIVTTPNYLSLAGISRVYRKLIGRPFHEVGQPINNPLIFPLLTRQLKKLGCRLDVVDGRGHLFIVPMYTTVELRWLEHPHFLTKWFAYHTLVVATKLRPSVG
jgi:ubiquinone/menaquinone biosynthesis C-methylase UbiE